MGLVIHFSVTTVANSTNDNQGQGYGFMQYIWEKEFVFYEEYCKTNETISNCESNCTNQQDDIEACIQDCSKPFICKDALSFYNFIFVVFRNFFHFFSGIGSIPWDQI